MAKIGRGIDFEIAGPTGIVKTIINKQQQNTQPAGPQPGGLEVILLSFHIDSICSYKYANVVHRHTNTRTAFRAGLRPNWA